MRRLTALRVSGGIAVVIAALRLIAPTPLELFDLKTLDLRYLLRGSVASGGEVVVVGIDEKSLDEVGRWPWPRQRLATLIDRLTAAGTSVIGLDIILDQPDTGVDLASLRAMLASKRDLLAGDFLVTLGPELTGDARLAAAFRQSGQVVLGHFFELGRGPSRLRPDTISRLPELSVRAVRGATLESVRGMPVARAAHLTVPMLTEAAASAGHLNVLPDVDGISRRLPLLIRVGEHLAPSLSLQLVRRYLGNEAATVTLAPGEIVAVRIGHRQLAVDAGGQLWVNYLGPPDVFPHVSAADVLAGRVPAAELAGKIALVGFTAIGFDEIATPFHPVGPGSQLQATVVDNLLHGRSLRRPRWLPVVEAAVVVLLGLAVGVLLQHLRGAGGWLAVLVVAALYAWGSQRLFTVQRIVLSGIYPLGAIVFGTLGAAVFQAVAEEREKRKIRDAFRHYLNPEVTDLLARDPTQLRLGGERREITILFSDIRGFTTIAEGLGPEPLAELLNEYLGVMTDIVFRHEGLLDKYIGDAVMAFWGAPIAVLDHARRCCRAALDMQAAVAVLCKRWQSAGVPALEIRVGINSGAAMVGNFGSVQRFSYTAMGDDVNLASRLEGLNKQYGTRVLITEATRRAIGEEFLCREIDRVVVTGRIQTVAVYELLGRAADDDGRLRRLVTDFESALSAYRARAWDEAAVRFEALLQLYPGDGATVSFLERCRVATAAGGQATGRG